MEEIYRLINELNDFLFSKDVLEIAIPVFGALGVAWIAFKWERKREREKWISELKNETVKTCDELRICDSTLRLNYSIQEYHKALSMFYKAKEGKMNDEKEKEQAKFYCAMEMSQAEHFQTRVNDFVQKYNEKESELLKLVSTLHHKIPEGIELKRLWHELNIRDVSYPEYNFPQHAVPGWDNTYNRFNEVHTTERERLQNVMQDKRSIQTIYEIQQLLNPTFFPVGNKRPRTRVEKIKVRLRWYFR